MIFYFVNATVKIKYFTYISLRIDFNTFQLQNLVVTECEKAIPGVGMAFHIIH